MLDSDLADLYGVTTKALNQAVKRNSERFPEDFLFRLDDREKQEVDTNCDHLEKLNFSPSLPFVFTELGVAMLSSVLRSPRAAKVNIEIMRAFVRLRKAMNSHEQLTRVMLKLEQRIDKHDEQSRTLFEAIDSLMGPENRPRIGFVSDTDEPST